MSVTSLRNVRVILRALAVCALALSTIASPAIAQQLPLRVSVDDGVYIVQGDTVTPEKNGGALDATIIRKALLAARVLDKQILNSELNRHLFDPVNRASVFSEEQSGRLLAPWQKPLLHARADNDEKALAAAKAQFKAWANNLTDAPREAAVAVVKQDYRDGIDAYRDNAAIFRSVMTGNKPLSYDDASAFLQNAGAVTRLAAARAIEAQLSDRGVTPPADIAAAGKTSPIAQRIQNDVAAKIDAATSLADLERLDRSLRRIALAEFPSLKDYDNGIKPALIRLGTGASSAPTVPSPTVNTATPSTPAPSQPTVNAPATATPSTVSVTTPVTAPKGLKPFGVVGSVTQPPALATNNKSGGPLPGEGRPGAAPAATIKPPAAPRTWRSGIPEVAPVGTPENLKVYSSKRYVAADGYVFSARDGVWQNPANPSEFRNPSVITCCDDTGLAFPSDDASSDDNLKTYSSKAYHSADGMVFNPHDGLWHDPKDADNIRIPTVITCCDDTGLAFPNDAVEAQQTYWVDLRGTDPNCGRLYNCGPAANPPVTADNSTGPADDPGGATDRDAEITRALEYLDKFPLDQKGKIIGDYLMGLPQPYRNRAIYLNRQFKGSGTASNRPVQNMSSYDKGVSGGRRTSYRNNQPANNSTITGLGGSGGGGNVTSRYEPITRSAAQNIVGKYKSIPGGVTLEGSGTDLPPLRKVVYLSAYNAFIINDDLVYLNPVSATDFAEIDKALREDDKLGVSLGATQLVYGALPPHGDVAMTLKMADRLLGAIAFSKQTLIANYRMAAGYGGRREPSSNLAVYFNFDQYNFGRDDSGQIVRAGTGMKVTLVPLRPDRSSNGGMLPDLDRAASGDLPQSYVDNLKHLQDNFAYYANERLVRRTLAYGEIAAFLRSVKAAGITPEIN